MYAGISNIVTIPSSAGDKKIIVASTGYVYLQLTYSWNKDKRQPNTKRVSIGKVNPGQHGTMFAGKHYEEYYGPTDPEVTRLRTQFQATRLAGKMDIRMAYGPYAIIMAVYEKTGCLSALQRSFARDWKLIVGLTVQAIVDETTTSQSFPGWCFDHYCGLDRVVSDSEVSDMYRRISEHSGDIKVFFSLYNKEFKSRYPCSSRRVTGFDSTNQNHYGSGVTTAEKGHPKIDLDLPITNTAMFADEETGMPLWYEHFDGSVLDKTQTPYSLDKVTQHGFQRLFIVFDRGYYSEDMIKEINRLEQLDYGILCPEGTTWVDNLIAKHGSAIKDKQQYYIMDENVYGNCYKVQPFEDGKHYYAYLFYDASRAEDERASVHSAFRYYWEKAESRKYYSVKMEKEFASKGIIVVKLDKPDPQTGKSFMLAEDTAHIQALLNSKGYFVMISPTKLKTCDAIHYIRNRDKVEKLFDRLMNHFGLRVTYRHNDATFEGLMFMAFIGLIGISGVTYYMKDILHMKTSTTLATIFAEMNKYKIEQHSDNKWYPGYAMSKTQKDICAKVGLTEESIAETVASIVTKSQPFSSGQNAQSC